MNSIVKVFSNFKEFYSEINGATLTGAIDVIVVEQPDGSYLCSPFHVRFGKLGVLRSREKVVDIEVNGEPVDIHMKLGESGEAFFVEECAEDELEILPEHLATSPIPTNSFNSLRFDDSVVNSQNNIIHNDELPMVLPRRNSIDLSTKDVSDSEKSRYENQASAYSHRRHTDNTLERRDLSTSKIEYTTQKIRQEWANEQDHQIFHLEGLDENSTNDWKNSTLLPATIAKDIGENDKQFRPINIEVCSNLETDIVEKLDDKMMTADEKFNKDETKSKKKRRKKSIMKKKNCQRKNSTSSSAGSIHSDQVDMETDSMTISNITLSSASDSPNDAPIISALDCNNSTIIDTNDPNDEKPITITASLDTPNRIRELDIHFFSDTEVGSALSPQQSRPSTPVQSDTEFEVSQREKSDVGNSVSASWNWGELPTQPTDDSENATNESKQAQRNSMLSGIMSFMKYNNKKMRKNVPEGLYLSDLDAESMDPEVAALYFGQASKNKNNQTNVEEDRESGNGTSLPQSPTSMEGIKDLDYDEKTHADKLSLDFIGISLCGGLDSPSGRPSEEEFEKNRLQYSDVCSNPSIFNSPNLVVRLNGKYFNWATACPHVMTMLAFQKPLPQDFNEKQMYLSTLKPGENSSIEHPDQQSQDQQQQQQPQQPDTRRGYTWWYWRRSADNKNSINQSIDESGKNIPQTIATQTSRSNSPDDQTLSANIEKLKEDGYNGSMSSEDSDLNGDKLIHQGDNLRGKNSGVNEKFRKSLRLSSDQIESLNLKNGMNEIDFSVTTAYQGTSRCKCYLFKWKHSDKVVISDIDGTITKSDVLGHILPMVGKDWAQIGVAQLFSKIEENGYKLLYLSARAIGQSRATRDYLQSIRQGDVRLPDGPLLLNPTSLISAFHREVIEKKPEQFKIACLSDIQALFPDKNPFYAGYGNRINDVWAYRAVGIPIMRIFTINTKGELKHELTQTFQSTYAGQSMVVNDIFPPIIRESTSLSDVDSCFNDDDDDDDGDNGNDYENSNTLQFGCDIEY
uniref:phosphatidate phosphatase n=1 Tax=Corethrella appendiculata TaxID=1370023 RepID=U5EXA3_9DIPT